MATPCEALPFPSENTSTPQSPPRQHKTPSLVVSLAGTLDEIRQCQRLRYSVFAEEMGASLDTTIPCVDQDAFDPLSKHLMVRNSRNGEIVGTTRLLIDSNPDYDSHYYSGTEFNIQNVLELSGRLMEVGRTCIHPGFRNGSTIAVLWQGIARMMMLHDVDYLMGCASISLDDGGANAAAVVERLREKHYAAPHLRVYPKTKLPEPVTDAVGPTRIPSLLKAYLRLGAVICGEPHWDADFNVADVFVLMDRDQMDSRYARHFVQSQF